MAPGFRRSSRHQRLAAASFAACLIVATGTSIAQQGDPPAFKPPPGASAEQNPDADARTELENSQVGRLIERFTYAAIIGVLLLCGMGLPLPEEVPILTSAILSQTGHLRPWWALGACMFGVMAGDLIMFYLGRRWGTHVLDHRLSRKLLTAERQQAIAKYFERYGAWIIFGGRFLPGIRAPLFLSAGTMGVTFWTFLAMDGAAALLSIPASFWLAYLFTDKLQDLLDLREHVHFWAMGLLGAGLLIWLILHRFWEKRRPSAAAVDAEQSATAPDEQADPLTATRE